MNSQKNSTNLIQGKLLYQWNELSVYQTIENSYLITDGNLITVTNYLPCLNASVLRSLLPYSAGHYERWQMERHGNILPKSIPFVVQDREAEAERIFERQQQEFEFELNCY